MPADSIAPEKAEWPAESPFAQNPTIANSHSLCHIISKYRWRFKITVSRDTAKHGNLTGTNGIINDFKHHACHGIANFCIIFHENIYFRRRCLILLYDLNEDTCFVV